MGVDIASRDALIARLRDCAGAARAGRTACTSFLSPGERLLIPADAGGVLPFALYGGYRECERAAAVFLPDWTLYGGEDADALFDGEDDFGERAVGDDFDPCASSPACAELRSAVRCVRIDGSGSREIGHRDVLGSLVSLGVRRDFIGDICCKESGGESAIYVFLLASIAPFVLDALERVGGDRVRVREVVVPFAFDSGRRYESVTDTVASERLDCVVAALANVSRERASELIEAGLVEHNYATAAKTSAPVAPGDVVSVRGKGKFVLDSMSDRTKKGRLRLAARKYL